MAVSPFEMLNAVHQQIGQLLPDVAKSAQEDLNQQAKAALLSLISRLDLVTREEFEIQQEVLLRTREKLEAIEKKIAHLEAQFDGAAPIAPEQPVTPQGGANQPIDNQDKKDRNN